MKQWKANWLGCVAVATAAAWGSNAAGQPPAVGQGTAAVQRAAADGKTVYVLFYNEWDGPVAAVAQVVKGQAEREASRVTWAPVQVGNPAEKGLVDRFGVGQAPMPLVLALHPLGAVTGVFPQRVTEADLTRSLVSPKQAECMAQLQQRRLVLLCVQPSPQQPLPPGVAAFAGDPQFSGRTQVVTLFAGDPQEAGFLRQFGIEPAAPTPTTVFMAPPGVLVGRFAATASGADLARALHSAGKCCDDPNCKHNHNH